tara:strand:+ start:615 stop:944 length:330 start_codon:yes stop_codon:yes gene_type:complete
MAASFSSYSASSVICEGEVETLGVHGTDRVMLKLSGMNTVVQICHLNNTMGTDYPITAEQCKTVYSTLLTGYSMSKNMRIHFDNIEIGTSCNNFKSWEVATTRWVYLSN